MKIRARVIRDLAMLYIDNRFKDLGKRKHILKKDTIGTKRTIEELRKHVETRVEELYPRARYNDTSGAVFPEFENLPETVDHIVTNKSFESGFEFKQTTMPDASTMPEDVFASIRPSIVVDEASADNALSLDTVAEHALCSLNDLPVTMSNSFENQFISEYLPRIFPWCLQYDCGGPEYPELFSNWGTASDEFAIKTEENVRERWRRVRGEAVLLPGEPTKMLATRAEAHLGADWMLVPAARNLHWRYQVLHSSFITCKQKIASRSSPEENLAELITATTRIFERLLKGSVVINKVPMPINGNIGLLFRADNIIATEKILLHSYLNTTSSIAGCQALRTKLGHCLFGLRVVHGECIFITISPNRRHNTLLWRLSRARENDPFINTATASARARKMHCGPDDPRLFVPSGTQEETDLEK